MALSKEQISRLESKLSELKTLLNATGYDCDDDDMVEHIITKLDEEINEFN